MKKREVVTNYIQGEVIRMSFNVETGVQFLFFRAIKENKSSPRDVLRTPELLRGNL